MFLIVNLNVTLFPPAFYFLRATLYTWYMVRQFRLSVRLYVRPSATGVDFIKTAEHMIEILSLSDRPVIL